MPASKIRDFRSKNPERRGKPFSAAHILEDKHILYTKDPEHPNLVLLVGRRLAAFSTSKEHEALGMLLDEPQLVVFPLLTTLQGIMMAAYLARSMRGTATSTHRMFFSGG
ncbi:MAG: hypothetical protein ABII71_01225 [Candidatus Micrarchaeota archaeon]